jgi:SAM-dependent methyltransferase
MKNIEELERNWEGFAQTDPLWAILSDPLRKGGKWNLQDFFKAGTSEIATMMEYLNSIKIKPRSEGRALDFGCGVGRLTQALAGYFASSTGVDISSTMIAQAKELNKLPPKCDFVVNKRSDLELFETAHFDFIYSSIVLQHIDPLYSSSYIREFIRVLKPGGYAVFQIPDSLIQHAPSFRERISNTITKLRIKLALRDKLHCLLPQHVDRSQKVIPAMPSDEFQMEMHCVPEVEIRRIVGEEGARVVDVAYTTSTEANFNGRLQYLKSKPSKGSISKQYCVEKEGTRV